MRPRDSGSAEQNVAARTQINILRAGENLRTRYGPKAGHTAARRGERVSGSGYCLGKWPRAQRRPLATYCQAAEGTCAVRR